MQQDKLHNSIIALKFGYLQMIIYQ